MNKTRALSAAVLALVVAASLSCETNHAPDVPARPTGPAYCFKDTTYTFQTVLSDPDGDSMVVRFDWGDSSDSHWMGWFASGDTVASAHAWSDTGNYEVRVAAQDRERTSDLSDGLKVRVAIRWPPETPAAPLGPGSGGVDTLYTFKAGSDHPEGMPVAIRFAWGDGDTSDWSDFDLPGAPHQRSHCWSEGGAYLVTAQSKDTGGLTSQWSAPHRFTVDPRDTLLLWRVQLGPAGSEHSTSPAIAPDGTICVASTNGGVYAISRSGEVRWRYQTGGPVYSSPAIALDGTIYVGSSDSSLYAINPNGTLHWRFQTGGGVGSSPAIASNGTIYVGSDDYKLYAVNSDGSERWAFVTGGGVNSSPAIAADGTVYIYSHDGYLYSVDPDGSLRWSYSVGLGRLSPTPAIGSDGTIYCGAELTLCALHPDGSLKWARSTSVYGDVSTSPAVAVEGTIYVPGTEGLYALNPDSTLRWSFTATGPNFSSSPAISSDGTIYFGSYFFFYALRPDGSVKWKYTRGLATVSSPSIGCDGTVYFASIDGCLYAFRGTSPLADSPWPKFHHDLRNTGQASAGSGRLRMMGGPVLSPDSAGFLIRVVNVGTVEVAVNWLDFYDAPDSAFMRDFRVELDHGRYPIPNGQPGTGPGDTVRFTAPVTIAPYGAQNVELYFAGFHAQEVINPPPGILVNVHGKTFRFRFSDGSVITVNP